MDFSNKFGYLVKYIVHFVEIVINCSKVLIGNSLSVMKFVLQFIIWDFQGRDTIVIILVLNYHLDGVHKKKVIGGWG